MAVTVERAVSEEMVGVAETVAAEVMELRARLARKVLQARMPLLVTQVRTVDREDLVDEEGTEAEEVVVAMAETGGTAAMAGTPEMVSAVVMVVTVPKSRLFGRGLRTFAKCWDKPSPLM
jgi:cell division ATPase FtsA